MMVIRNRFGTVIRSFNDLSGIQNHVDNNVIRVLDIVQIDGFKGKLYILFLNGDSFETEFADFEMLKDFVCRWKSAYGAPLWINGKPASTIGPNNPQLRPVPIRLLEERFEKIKPALEFLGND